MHAPLQLPPYNSALNRLAGLRTSARRWLHDYICNDGLLQADGLAGACLCGELPLPSVGFAGEAGIIVFLNFLQLQ